MNNDCKKDKQEDLEYAVQQYAGTHTQIYTHKHTHLSLY